MGHTPRSTNVAGEAIEDVLVEGATPGGADPGWDTLKLMDTEARTAVVAGRRTARAWRRQPGSFPSASGSPAFRSSSRNDSPDSDHGPFGPLMLSR
jgi:hypothetical protein